MTGSLGTAAICQGLGKTEGDLERIVFEATGPKGVAILVETLTDKRTRTLTLLRTLLHRHRCGARMLSAPIDHADPIAAQPSRPVQGLSYQLRSGHVGLGVVDVQPPR